MHSTQIRNEIAQVRADLDAIIASGDVSVKAAEKHTASKDRLAFLNDALRRAEEREADEANAKLSNDRAALAKWFDETCHSRHFIAEPVQRVAAAYAAFVAACRELAPAKDAWKAARVEGRNKLQGFPGGVPHEEVNHTTLEGFVAAQVEQAVAETLAKPFAPDGCLPNQLARALPNG